MMPVPRRMRRRARGHMGQEDKRRRKPAFRFMEVVLRHPGGVKSMSLRVDDLLGGEAITLACARLIEKAGEEAEPFGLRGYCHRFAPLEPSENQCRSALRCPGNRVDEFARVGAARTQEHVLDAAAVDLAAVVQDRDRVRDLTDHGEIVGDEEVGQPKGLLEFVEQLRGSAPAP